MLIVAGTITVDPADVERLRDAATTMMAATLEEPGCHEYSFNEHLAKPGHIQIFEMWQSPEDLELHFETPHMAAFRAVLSELSVGVRDIYRYEVASQTRL